MENLESVIESVVFVAGEPVLISDLCVKFDVKQKQIEKAVQKLQEKYNAESGIQLLCFNNKLQFASNPKNVDAVSAVLNPIRQRNLTKATLETVAIIAYKQPVTRLEIEEIRGVNSDYAINILLEHKLIEVVGHKDAVGRPSLFGTTDEFLKRFDISAVGELPKYEDLMAQIEKIKENYSEALFNRFEPVAPVEEDLDKKLAEINKTETPKNDEDL
ncbi:MAG: SMC-Scp complex subunit ScpB [Clostridiales bacterium]|nr:SMC-Scp complex subunit ScpB [Clostridiales bacterium]